MLSVNTRLIANPKCTFLGFASAEKAENFEPTTWLHTAELSQNRYHGGKRSLLNLKNDKTLEVIDDLFEAEGSVSLPLQQAKGYKNRDDILEDAVYMPQDAPPDERRAPQYAKSMCILPDTRCRRSIHAVSQNGSSKVDKSMTQFFNTSSDGAALPMEGLPCEGVIKHIGFATACDYVRAIPQCKSASVIDYTRFFFCTCAKFTIIGYITLTFWLLILFYSLGNTAADYFCCSLEKLSKLLKCPPTVAGVTLLPLGNGAPDVFASIAAFVGAGVGQVGLNSVLGGGVFVTTIVAGLVSLLTSNSQSVKLDRRSFVRDVCFYLFTIASLVVILVVGQIYLWSALAFLSIYGFYAIAVATLEIIKRKPKRPEWSQIQLLPFTTGPPVIEEEDDSIYSPLLDPTTLPTTQAEMERTTLPQWMWASNVAIYSQQSSGKRGETSRPLWGWIEEQEGNRLLAAGTMFVYILQWPLSLPRRLTIPVVEDDRWSHKFALASAALAPIFFTLVLDSQEESTFFANKGLYIGAVLVGLFLATLAYFTTKPETPPTRFSFPWVVGGFFMSIVWFFVIANELVALLVTFGIMLEINPAILGLTVLAWGNSIGDLMANIALASNGGDGVQIAFSGCYAGPMFNTLIGLGISFVMGSWRSRPHAFAIPRDNSIYYTAAFLIVGLLWALVILPLKKMKPSKLLGAGLLILYIIFLGFQLAHFLGFVPTAGW